MFRSVESVLDTKLVLQSTGVLIVEGVEVTLVKDSL